MSIKRTISEYLPSNRKEGTLHQCRNCRRRFRVPEGEAEACHGCGSEDIAVF